MRRPRDGYQPGQIVEHRQRFVVTAKQYPDGRPKLHPVSDTWAEVGRRWSVRRNALLSRSGIDPYWVADGGADDWALFDTWAEAYAYADKRAREAVRCG